MKPNRPRHVQQQWRKGTSVAPILPCFFAWSSYFLSPLT
jgi:hypothetical protein